MKVKWSQRALRRVDEIAERIAADRPAAAETWADGVFAAVWRLASFPESGRMLPELRQDRVREVIHREYRIIDRIEADRIDVLTVRHSSQRTDREDVEG